MRITTPTLRQTLLPKMNEVALTTATDESTSNAPLGEEGASTSTAEPGAGTPHATPNRMGSNKSRLLQILKNAALKVQVEKQLPLTGRLSFADAVLQTLAYKKLRGGVKENAAAEQEAFWEQVKQHPLSATQLQDHRNQLFAAWRNFQLENMEIESIDSQPFVHVPSVSAEKPFSGSHKWPSLICTFTINKETGELAWAGEDVDTQRRRKKDAHALSGLFAELNSSPAFKAQMKEIAQSLPDDQGFEIKYKMGEQMNRLYNDFRARFNVKEAFLWKNADVARQRHKDAAETNTNIAVQEDDYVRLDLTGAGERKGVSVLSAALRGIDKQGSRWDEKTGHDDYAKMAEVMPDITIRVPRDKNDSKGKAPETGASQKADEIQAAMDQELRQDSHKAFRAKQANIHARYQAGKIEHSWGALAGSMIGGGVYSLGMMMLNNQLNRSMIPSEVQKEHGLDKQSIAQKLFTDVTEDLLPVATPLQKFMMTFNPSWQLGSWEVFDNAILDAVLGGDDDEEESDDASVHSNASSSASGSETQEGSWKDALWNSVKEKAHATTTAISELTAEKVWDGVKSAAATIPKMAGEMASSASFAVPAGAISGVFSWPDKAIEIWKPGSASEATFKDGLKLGVTSPMSSLACSSGFFLKMGETAAETEAAVLQALTTGQLAWPEHNPFNSSQPFDRRDLDQVKRVIWDMTQDQLNNEPDPLAIRLSVPWEFLSGVVQGGISMIPGMSQAISFALDTLFFGPGELLWMNMTGAFSNHANKNELRAELAKVQQRCEESNASPRETRMAALQFMLDHKLISEDALEQWQTQKTAMLGGAMIHHVYERSGDVKNAGRIAMRNLFVDMPGWAGGKVSAAMPEAVHAIGTQVSEQTSRLAGATGDLFGQGLDAAIAAGVGLTQGIMRRFQGEDYQPDEQAAARYSAAFRELSKNAASSIADCITPEENNMRIRARLPYTMVLEPRIQNAEDNINQAEIAHSQASSEDVNRESEQERMAEVLAMHGLTT